MTQVFDVVGPRQRRSRLAAGLTRLSLRLLLVFTWATLVATVMSTEFLAQPFVWRNYDLPSILAGWGVIWRDRIVVAWTLAAFLLGVPQLSGRWRAQILLYLAAVIAGAGLGETVLTWMSPQDERQSVVVLLGRVARWTLVGGAVATIVQFWRSGLALAAQADESRVRAASLRRSAASAELEMLRRQIEPHFLFNTLATIRRLCETDPAQSRFLFRRLLQFLSSTMTDAGTQFSSLGEEVALVSAYLDVCASRMGGRLSVSIRLEPGLGAIPFPPLVLATLAENAMKHGIFPQNGGSIDIQAAARSGRVEVVVADDGVGFSGEGGGGLGLANIVERLRLLYGSEGEFRLSANTPKGVRALVRIPVQSP